MLFLLAMLAATGAAPNAGHSPAPAAAAHHCALPKVSFALLTGPQSGVRRLGEEPPAKQYLAVDRNVGGCPEPAVVRTGIGR